MQYFIFDIIDSTIDLCPIYKINFSFYERYGAEGYKIVFIHPKSTGGVLVELAEKPS